MGVGLFRFPVVVAISAASTFIASADELPPCPANAAQTGSQIIQHFRTADPIDQQVITVANNIAAVCEDDYVANLALAEAWISLSQRTGITLQQKFETAERAMTLLMRMETLPSVAHNYKLAGEARKKTVTQLVAIADAGGPKIDWLDGKTQFPVCERGFTNPAQTLWHQYKKDHASLHTPILLKAQAKACETETVKDPLKYLAEYYVDLAERTEDPEEAFEHMKAARDLYDKYGGEDQSGLGWNPELRGFFDRKFIKAGLRFMTADNAMPKADLFKAENMKLNRSKLDLQYYIDQSWWPVARDENGKLIQEDVTERMRTHMYLIRDLAELARAESKDAEWYLYRALKDHRDNGFRTEANLDADNPPEFVREIYNPNKKSE
jgi:hypothetical protein